jgi:DNA polymerase/3'-5' exonuclease PolX
MNNAEIAGRLDEVAQLLTEQEANPFRVRAHRNAAAAIRELPVPVAQIYHDDGLGGLEQIRNVGPAIARAIGSLVTRGRVPMLERLRGEADPVQLLATVPGIGPGLAERLHHDLGIDALEELGLALGRTNDLGGDLQRRTP